MKTYIFLSITFIIMISLNSCSNKSSDALIPENNPSGYYTYKSSSKYYKENSNNEPISNTSEGFMNINWYQGNSSINISINPFYGYSYYLEGEITETHGDTTLFRLRGQVVSINNKKFTVIGNSGVEVPNLGRQDGYFVQDKKIVYSFKSTDNKSYETTETYTKGDKK